VKLFYSDEFVLPLPEWHRFPMSKYRLLRERVLAEGLAGPGELFVPMPATVEQLLRVHDADYVRRCMEGDLSEAEVREIGFPWSPGLVERSRRSSGATIEACRAALSGPARIGVNLAGGTHHAAAGKGAGYCMFNDSAVAARAMRAEGRADRVMVVDCDVHHGDGTASIFAGDESVFTFSIHGAKNYPLRKPPSDLDVPLPDGVGDADYLAALAAGLDAALGRFRPDLAIYLAGADPFEGDALGRLKVTKAGLEARDRMVLGRLRGEGLPVAVAMAGGYSKAVEDIVEIHARTVAVARELA
jgi:acetoin utilization deacetylase AcuC-like enzyme